MRPTVADDPRAVLARIRERAEKAGDELDRLTEGGGPAATWRWSIPANPERDSDLLIGASQGDVPRMARALEAVLEHADSAAVAEIDNDYDRGYAAAMASARTLINDALEAKP